MTKTRKTGRTKSHAKSEANGHTNGSRRQPNQLMHRVQEGLREAGEALREAGETFGGEGRKVALTMVNHAQDNVVWSFEALRDTIQAETFADAVKIQQHALTELFRRSLRQMREVGEIVTDSSTKSIKPITKFVTSLRDERRAA